MADDVVLEKLLARIHEGDRDRIATLLVRVAQSSLILPASEVIDVSDGHGTNKVKVATFHHGPRRLVPCFADKHRFERWSQGRFQAFAIHGADLAIALPPETWVVLNPGQPLMFELSPQQLVEINQLDPKTAVGELDSDFELPLTADEISEMSFSFSDEESPLSDSFDDQDASAKSSILIDRLQGICEEYPEVQEAYLQIDPAMDVSQAVVGLLTYGMDAERRFMLIDSIADLSRDIFGSAGAIDVYDDLDLRTSKSWELFNALSPVYEKAPDYGRSDRSLRGEIETLYERPSIEERTGQAGLSWKSMRKTGHRLLGAIRGVIRTQE